MVPGCGGPDVIGTYKSSPKGTMKLDRVILLELKGDSTFTITDPDPGSTYHVVESKSGTYKVSDIGISPPPFVGSIYLYPGKSMSWRVSLDIIGKDLLLPEGLCFVK